MNPVAVTIHLPETLVKQFEGLGLLTSEHIEILLRADLEAQLKLMSEDPEIQREIKLMNEEFAVTEMDGLETL